jgi:hypothetical protein
MDNFFVRNKAAIYIAGEFIFALIVIGALSPFIDAHPVIGVIILILLGCLTAVICYIIEKKSLPFSKKKTEKNGYISSNINDINYDNINGNCSNKNNKYLKIGFPILIIITFIAYYLLHI